MFLHVPSTRKTYRKTLIAEEYLKNTVVFYSAEIKEIYRNVK